MGYRRGISTSISTLRLRVDDSTRILRDGRLVVGRRPAHVVHLTAAGGRCVSAWRDGAAVGDSSGERALAARLIDAELAHPAPADSPWTTADVAVVIPARDRAELLAECLQALGPVAEVLVVDDCSDDRREIEAVARGVGLLRLDRRSGPAAARNAGLAATKAPLIAFIDADARPLAGWLEPLLAQCADPLVGAVAPRIRVPAGRSTLDVYEAARSPLDMGARAGLVGPGRRVRFVPATALVVRRDAAADGFDDSLRFGEDVDFVWRLAADGWMVRYEPAACVEHSHRHGLRPWLGQRVEYGSSAAPLATRHPGQLSHLVLPSSVIPALPAGLRRDLVPLVATAQVRFARQILDAAWRAYPPLVLAAAARSRRAGRLAAAALVISTTADYLERRPRLDPLRFGALRVADDLSYAAGVWRGCIEARNPGPLIPRATLSSSSRRTARR
ncbi:MAG: mycofactocin biosynthesis glycosyltransferase MftF [Solirubrobacteraceae bacterium]